ncbi:MAG: restriction endonuclease [Planctomycetota bacterium]
MDAKKNEQKSTVVRSTGFASGAATVKAFATMAMPPEDAPAILLQTLVEPLSSVSDGQVIRDAGIPWLEIFKRIQEDPEFLYGFVGHPRKFEEFLAASYDRAGYDEVVLTPRSNDGGRDVIAIKKGFASIRILEQAKAYKPGHLVTHDDVGATLSTLLTDTNSSKAIITTTSDFQPRVTKGDRFKHLMPYRLELKNGKQLATWISQIAKGDAS